MYPTRVASRSSADAIERDDQQRLEEERRAIERVLAGDAQSFRLLVERHQRSVFAVIQRLVRNGADADDLAQQAFLSAYDALPRFDLELKFAPWLLRIAVNLAKDHLKSKKRSEVGLDGNEPDGEAAFAGRVAAPDEATHDRERQAVLERALGRLSIADREVIVLKDIEEISYEEMKQILGKPITALKIRVIRARQRLRAELEKLAGEGAL